MSDEKQFEHRGRAIRDEVRIEAPPEVVYRAWTDPEAVTAWFLGGMTGRIEEGETVTWRWDDEGPGMTQHVLAADPPRRFVTRMDLPQGASYLEVTIEQEGGHSVVRLVQSGFEEGPEWDDEFESMLSGWLMALGILKLFAERYWGRKRREVVVLAEAPWEREQILELQRSEGGLTRWLARSGSAGRAVGESVRLVLENGKELNGVVLRATSQETLWSWDEIDGVVELKAFRGAAWGSQVGIRISSWLEDAAELADLEGWVVKAVGRLVAALTDGA